MGHKCSFRLFCLIHGWGLVKVYERVNRKKIWLAQEYLIIWNFFKVSNHFICISTFLLALTYYVLPLMIISEKIKSRLDLIFFWTPNTYTVKCNCVIFLEQIVLVRQFLKRFRAGGSSFCFGLVPALVVLNILVYGQPNKLLCLLENPLMQFHNGYVQCLKA